MSMTTRSRNFQRTPRRRKLFVTYSKLLTAPNPAASPYTQDMLDEAFTDLGMSNMGGLTFMRLTGEIRLANGASFATTATTDSLRIGFNWLDPNVAAAGDGDGQIPEPLVTGIRESKWIQQWELFALEPSTGGVQNQLIDTEGAFLTGIDVRNMRKQPAANSKLTLVVGGGLNWELNTVAFHVNFNIMLALP